jgi:thiol-disulfide isomerase/thioredoxin
MRRAGKSNMVDFFRKVPADLTEATAVGASLSLCAAVFMAVLFVVELWAFLSTTIETAVVIDTNSEPLLRINFNVTMLDLACEFATVDVVDVLGTNQMNVTKNVEKWELDASGKRMTFWHRNKEAKAIAHDDHVHGPIEALHANGVHAVDVDATTFAAFVAERPTVFINFYAPWCIWCQRLEPTWEAFAEEVERVDGGDSPLHVDVARVDCVANEDLCRAQGIRAFPTLRLFKHGKQYGKDYKEDRTVDALVAFLESHVTQEERMKDWHPARRARVVDAADHPGCMVSGYVMVHRVPGNFHVEARSKHHDLNPTLTNLSHVVNHYSVGSPLAKDVKRKVARLFPEYTADAPLDGRAYVTQEYHAAVHHFSKVVSTHFQVGGLLSVKDVVGYQMLAQSQVMHYGLDDVPEARFAYDLSPMAVVVSSKSRRWYDFVTSVCAIIGGTFTVVGLLDGALHKLLKSGKQL